MDIYSLNNLNKGNLFLLKLYILIIYNDHSSLITNFQSKIQNQTIIYDFFR